MPRARRVPAQRNPAEDDGGLTNLDALDLDPEPAAPRRPGRPRKAPTTPLLKAPGKIPARNSKGQIMSAAQMQAQVHGDLVLYIGLARIAWELRDEECAASLTDERVEEIAARGTRLIARNEKLLSAATNGGALADVLSLLGTVLPILGTVWKAHGPGGAGHHHQDQDQGVQGARAFPAYTG